MNYRHSFHAGNSADVVKHSLLIALVQALQLKQSALTLIDTHSGCGLYDLHGEEAGRTGEANEGVLQAFADQNPLLDDYRAAVAAVNGAASMGAAPRLYPGSPRILAQLLRPQDLLILNEKHPEDAYALRGAMRGAVGQTTGDAPGGGSTTEKTKNESGSAGSLAMPRLFVAMTRR
jgi:23S rRNA (adenine2030-N6)-methyltransferase